MLSLTHPVLGMESPQPDPPSSYSQAELGQPHKAEGIPPCPTGFKFPLLQPGIPLAASCAGLPNLLSHAARVRAGSRSGLCSPQRSSGDFTALRQEMALQTPSMHTESSMELRALSNSDLCQLRRMV